MKDDKNNFQQMEFNNNFNYDTEDLNLQHYSLNEEINENNYNNNLLNGLNSDLNVLLANLKSSKSTDKMRYNISNTKLKSPSQYKTDTNNISNFNLIDEFNNLVENNSRRNINYFSPVHFQDPILIKEKLSRKKNISHISNPKIKNNENSFLTKTDYINGCFNENSNYFFSQPINIKKNDNYYLNQRRTLNINNQRNIHHSKKLNNSNTNRLVNNNKILNFNDNNVSNQNFEISELYELIKKIKGINLSNIENINDVLNIQQEFRKIKNMLLSEISKLIGIKQKKNFNSSQRQEEINLNLKLKEINDMKNNLLFDANILNKEKSSLLDEISRLKKNEQQNLNLINSKEEENLKLRKEINNLKGIREEFQKIKENVENLENEINIKEKELNKLKKENANLLSEIDKYKNIMKDVKINLKNQEFLQNKVLEQEKIINEYVQKDDEKEENFENQENLKKENKEMKRQLLILQSQNKNITKEFKIKRDILDGLQGDHDKLVKERDDFKKQQNILNNEIKIMKMNNKRINNIKISLRLKDTIDNLTKEKKNLQEKNLSLQKRINEIDMKKYRSKSTNNFSSSKIRAAKKFHDLTKVNIEPFVLFSKSKKKEIEKRTNNIVKKRKFILEISEHISVRYIGGLEDKIKSTKEREKKEEMQNIKNSKSKKR